MTTLMINNIAQCSRQPINNIINKLQDHMFTSKNLFRFTKHIIQKEKELNKDNLNKDNLKKDNINKCNLKKDNLNKDNLNKCNLNKDNINKMKETNYKPKQTDSLFWCFYILKNGYFNYEMEISNQYFVIEKKEKFKYIDLIRKNKDKLKLHKIKPLTELEDDLANKKTISIKTFFALCVIEGINIILVDKRKIYEALSNDINEENPIHIVHRDSKNSEHFIELELTNEKIQLYKDSFYKMTSFDESLKSMTYYKLDELKDLCIKFNIDISKTNKNKLAKKDIYELLIQNF